MASFEGGFNAQAPENNASNVIPKGEYTAILIKSELKSTKDGRGSRLNLDFQILSGEFQNKHVFESLNIYLRRNEFNTLAEWEAALKADDRTLQAVTIARGQLSELCRAVNVINPQDSSELQHRPVIIKVGIQEANADFPAKNKITAYKPKGVTVQAPTMFTPPPANAPEMQSDESNPLA